MYIYADSKLPFYNFVYGMRIEINLFQFVVDSVRLKNWVKCSLRIVHWMKRVGSVDLIIGFLNGLLNEIKFALEKVLGKYCS